MLNLPEFLVVAGVLLVLRGLLDDNRRWFPFLFLVQGARSVVIVRRTLALVALLAALFVESQGEALPEFLQDAFLLALRARAGRILRPGSGHDVGAQVGGLLLEARMRDQGNSRLRQRMLGCYVTGRPLVLFLTRPLSTVQTTQ